ncbi:hypothetical protein OG863_00580 [Streptomyces decoyicus]|uniref:Uncharacterized protein n=1 Tax=Streptomyces decoyicus TaxID=249567 RepID=A0ABZ1F8S9_9ACTN|nr:hypothetical protein [Streptomyces decoyicus]WSB66606.1 hypothetical protein OG863_00580 [Streptomyces decoyicus]
MSDQEGQRRQRVLMAQRRPGPRRVRGRQQARRWWSRIDWGRAGTIFTIIAGIGSLLFTGIATYYGAAVAEEQLDQSREDADRKEREQAMRVATWMAQDGDGAQHLHLVNRSPDPIAGAVWDIKVDLGTSSFGNRVFIREALSGLGPCSEMVINWTALEYQEKWGGKYRKVPDTHAMQMAVAFTDRNGTVWERYGGRLTEITDFPHVGPLDRQPNEKVRIGRIVGKPSLKQAASCGYEDAPGAGGTQ